jgi:hypothetical protein
VIIRSSAEIAAAVSAKSASSVDRFLDRDLSALELLEVGGVRAELQAHERGTGHTKERRHHQKFDGAAEIIGLLGIAGPDHANLQSLQMGEAFLPALGRVGRGRR